MLSFRIDRSLPVIVVALTGTLSADTLPSAEGFLRDRLAEMPAGLVVDASGFDVPQDVGWEWFKQLANSAAHWPQAPMVLCVEQAQVHGALASLSGNSGAEKRYVMLPPIPSSCGEARALVTKACTDWRLPTPRRLGELLISELVANGVMHARTFMTVTVRRLESGIELSVRDEDKAPIPEAVTRDGDPRGFGLQLIAAMSDSWGWMPTFRGKVVWSRLAGVI